MMTAGSWVMPAMSSSEQCTLQWVVWHFSPSIHLCDTSFNSNVFSVVLRAGTSMLQDHTRIKLLQRFLSISCLLFFPYLDSYLHLERRKVQVINLSRKKNSWIINCRLQLKAANAGTRIMILCSRRI